MQMPSLTAFFATPALLTARPTRPDAQDIAKSVNHYCKLIGCNESNTVAALSWAFKTPGSDTLAAIRAGKQRANNLFCKQPKNPTTAA